MDLAGERRRAAGAHCHSRGFGAVGRRFVRTTKQSQNRYGPRYQQRRNFSRTAARMERGASSAAVAGSLLVPDVFFCNTGPASGPIMRAGNVSLWPAGGPLLFAVSYFERVTYGTCLNLRYTPSYHRSVPWRGPGEPVSPAIRHRAGTGRQASSVMDVAPVWRLSCLETIHLRRALLDSNGLQSCLAAQNST